MTFDDYQQQSRKTALYPDLGNNLVYPTLGLSDEVGEVSGKIKKYLRGDDGEGDMSPERREGLKKELGDVLWYVAQLATELDYSLNDIAQTNIDKLFSRLDRGVIKGDGDNR